MMIMHHLSFLKKHNNLPTVELDARYLVACPCVKIKI